jgi:hypothetical protein
MTEFNTNVAIADFDPFELTAGGKTDSKFITKIPSGQDKAIVCKIIPDPNYNGGKAWYRPLRQFQYQIGPNKDKDTRTKTCLSFFEEGASSPENDAFWENRKALAELKKRGQGESIEGKKLEALVAKLQSRNGGYLLIVEPDSPTIKALKVSTSVLDILNGKDATQYKPALPSLLKTMALDGRSPFDIRRNHPKEGWVRIYKTGEGLATRYFVEPVQYEEIVEQNGKKFKSTNYSQLTVHEKILSGQVTMSDIPDVVAFEKKNAWTREECDAFVTSGCVTVPERFLRKPDGRMDETNEEPRNSLASLADLPLLENIVVTESVSTEDIPF